MAIYDIRRVTKSEYLRWQPREIKKNGSYEFSGLTIVPRMNHKNTGASEFITGLTPEEEDYYEKQLGLPKGRLSKTSDFWTTFRIRISNDTVKKDDSIPMEAVEIKILKTLADPKIMGGEMDCLVADGIEELDKKSMAVLLISNPEQEADKELRIAEIKDKAVTLFSEMSEEDLKNFLLYINPYYPVSTANPKIIKSEVLKWRNENPGRFVDAVGSKQGKQRLEKVVLINKLVNKGIISQRNGSYYDGEELIGYDLQATLDRLFSPKGKQALEIYVEKLNKND